MPTDRINEILGFQMKDSDGNILMEFGDNIFEKEYDATWLLPDKEKLNPDNIEKVIFNPPATIVIFKDGTKTVVKAHNEDFDEEKGLLMALARHMFDSRAQFNRIVDQAIVDSYKGE